MYVRLLRSVFWGQQLYVYTTACFAGHRNQQCILSSLHLFVRYIIYAFAQRNQDILWRTCPRCVILYIYKYAHVSALKLVTVCLIVQIRNRRHVNLGSIRHIVVRDWNLDHKIKWRLIQNLTDNGMILCFFRKNLDRQWNDIVLFQEKSSWQNIL